MKIWKVLVLISVLITPLFLSSCDLLGIGGKSKEQKYYEQQLELIQKQQEANQKAQEEYNENLRKALEEYLNTYNQYQQEQLQQQIQAIEQAAKAKEQEDIPYN
jgi:membrane protein involved in colicin uptake